MHKRMRITPHRFVEELIQVKRVIAIGVSHSHHGVVITAAVDAKVQGYQGE